MEMRMLRLLITLVLVLGSFGWLTASDLEAEGSSNGTQKKRIRLVLGPSWVYHKDDHVDFREVRDTDTHLYIENDSRWRSGLKTGVSINLLELGGNIE